MKFVIGIGNLEKKYEDTRHNIGFRVVDRLGRSRNKSAVKWDERGDLKALLARLGVDVFAVKSTQFVNNTGGTVEKILQQFPGSEWLFVCDDVNLEFGKLRLRASGSAGGHHGLESVIAVRGEDFARLRVGVRNESMPQDLTGFVLEKFSAVEEKEIGAIVEKAVSVCESWIDRGFDDAMMVLSQLQSVK